MELLLVEDSTLQIVVEELAADCRPDIMCRTARLVHGVHECLGNGGVEPRDNGGVDLQPHRIMAHEDGVDGAVNVILQAELLKGEVEERAPLPEVGLIHV